MVLPIKFDFMNWTLALNKYKYQSLSFKANSRPSRIKLIREDFSMHISQKVKIKLILSLYVCVCYEKERVKKIYILILKNKLGKNLL